MTRPPVAAATPAASAQMDWLSLPPDGTHAAGGDAAEDGVPGSAAVWPWDLPEADTPLSTLDRALARFLQDTQPSPEPRHAWLAALVSHQFGRGHACLDLAALASQPAATLGWEPAALQGLPPALSRAADGLPWCEGAGSPLVRDGARLYLRRNWAAEQLIRGSIAARLALPSVAPEGLASLLARLFPPTPKIPGPDWQKVACALAARQRFTLITGGPGTGKTTTVVRLLALLQSSARQREGGHGQALRIALAAPTGKAAARLAESIASAVQHLPEDLRSDIPDQAQTLHKLLQVRPGVGHQAPPELALDLIVVDEASMIDLEMMARLLTAVPPRASVILLGDKDQLASVEAGAVMGQLCEGADAGGYSAATVAWLAEVAAEDVSRFQGDGGLLAQQTVMLRFSRRFAGDSEIGQWAHAVNQGQLSTVQGLWRRSPRVGSAPSASVDRLEPAQATDPALAPVWQRGWAPWRALMATATGAAVGAPASAGPGLETPAAGALGPVFDDRLALQALAAFNRFQVLCAVRDGPWGVEALNRRIAQALGLPTEGWYAGRPVMVTRNDYALQLMNGDVGLCLPHAKGLRVAFADGHGGVRWVQPSRLDAVESVFAMTVHKSQGSEFEHVALVLPEVPVAVLTRELLYTGITRAKTRLTLVVPGVPALWRAVEKKVVRSGGLGGGWPVPAPPR
ncbi:exodeoxyribonuclease V subunit alpha [Curvibacter sp. HBC61]|uniref:RecBCD enzyme subunit RecD n=1 Tax=Curvibacter cyanobacteriorum TaxID=3026422 RepID=A0ABT5MZJ1_9BURK|nr:exodeoxyribonuclease V subunit alpha [Curvibacter sp. HBC61]MDD0838178.1 exodeoxyribonuclease V subunit alpha [Curvibacter sp. HBC61]